MARGRTGSPECLGVISDRRKGADHEFESAMCADRTSLIDHFRTIRRQDHAAGVKIAVTEPVARRQTVDQGSDAIGNTLRSPVARAAHRMAHPCETVSCGTSAFKSGDDPTIDQVGACWRFLGHGGGAAFLFRRYPGSRMR
jgi:hypothetical protein